MLFEHLAAGDAKPGAAAVLEDEFDLIRAEGVINGHAHEAAKGAGIIHHGPFGAVFAQNPDPIALFQPVKAKGQGQPFHPALDFFMGKGFPFAVFFEPKSVLELMLEAFVKELGDRLNQGASQKG